MKPTASLLFSLSVITIMGCGEKAPSTDEREEISCGEGTHLDDDRCLPDASADADADADTDADADADADVDADTDADADDTGEPEDSGGPIESTKSPKRGLAYNLTNEIDMAAISGGVSWWYNWYFKTDATADFEDDYAMHFVPMIWGHNPEVDYVELESWMLDHPTVNDLLVMNEPNLIEQANITPTEAVGHWVRYEQFQAEMLEDHGRSIRLIGPAITWGTMPDYADPIGWMDAFYAAFNASEGRDPIIDALAFHWYDYGLDDQLTRLEGYGKPFWVKEMANWHTEPGWTIDTPEKQINEMIDMVDICENRDDVERYAWFIGRWDPDPHYTSLFGPDPGALTELGEAYLDQPW